MANDYTELYDIISYIGPIIKDGIRVGSRTINFTMLDYYSLTKEDISDLLSALLTRRVNVEKPPYYSYFYRLFEREGSLVKRDISVTDVLNEHNAFIIDNYRFEPTEEDIQKIFNLFDEYDIPKYSRLIYTALYRTALGVPILPLVMEDKNKIR